MIEGRTLPSIVALEDVLRRGREALAAGHVEGALRTFDAAIRIKPSYAPAWRAKGRALRTTGDAKAALECYMEALRHEPGDEASWLGFALTLHALGRLEDELLAYDEIIRRNPRNVAAWMNRGVALHEAGKYEDALACFDRILTMRPELAAAWNNRGAAFLRLKRDEDALASFDEALALDPMSADAAMNRRTTLERLRREAPEPGALVLPETDPLPASVQSRVLANLGLPAIDAWRRNRPASADDFASFGGALLDQGAPEGALAAFRKSETMGGGALASVGKVVTLEVLDDARKVSESDRLLEFADTPRAIVAAATIRERSGDLAGARDAYATLLDHRPGLAWAWTAKGMLELRMGRASEARVSFERATTADPTDADAWANLAAAHLRDGRPADAFAACEHALALEPESAVALNNRGVILAGMGRGEEAASVFREAAKRSDEASVAVNRALLADSLDQVRAALDLYDEAIRRLPKDTELVAARRKVLGRLGARERKSRATLRSRLEEVPGIGPSAAARLIQAGFDSAAKIRRASVSELRDAPGLSAAQASGLKRAFRA